MLHPSIRQPPRRGLFFGCNQPRAKNPYPTCEGVLSLVFPGRSGRSGHDAAGAVVGRFVAGRAGAGPAGGVGGKQWPLLKHFSVFYSKSEFPKQKGIGKALQPICCSWIRRDVISRLFLGSFHCFGHVSWFSSSRRSIEAGPGASLRTPTDTRPDRVSFALRRVRRPESF